MSKVKIGKTYKISVPKGGYTEYETYQKTGDPYNFLYTTTSWRAVDVFVTIQNKDEAELLEYYIKEDTTGTFELDSDFEYIEFEGSEGAYDSSVENEDGEEVEDNPLFNDGWEFMECESYYECPIKIKEVERNDV